MTLGNPFCHCGPTLGLAACQEEGNLEIPALGPSRCRHRGGQTEQHQALSQDPPGFFQEHSFYFLIYGLTFWVYRKTEQLTKFAYTLLPPPPRVPIIQTFVT